MMRRLVLTAAAVTGLALVPPQRAQAQLLFDNYCVTNFNVCASVRVFTSGKNLTMQVWNLNGVMGVSHTMTAVGLYHLGSQIDWAGKVKTFSARYVTTTGSTDVTKYWSPKMATDIKTLAAENIEVAQGTNGNKGGIVGCTDPGGQLHYSTCQSFPNQPLLELNFGLDTPFDLAGAQLRFHSQQLPNGSSAKCDTGLGGSISYGPCQGPPPPPPPPPPPEITPEPVTIALLGTGLFGVGGAGFLRRRRKDQLE
jgi:hypothetical protein